jgi:hypothetical protein
VGNDLGRGSIGVEGLGLIRRFLYALHGGEIRHHWPADMLYIE